MLLTNGTGRCAFRNEALYIDCFSQHHSHENEGLFRRSYK